MDESSYRNDCVAFGYGCLIDRISQVVSVFAKLDKMGVWICQKEKLGE